MDLEPPKTKEEQEATDKYFEEIRQRLLNRRKKCGKLIPCNSVERVVYLNMIKKNER